MKKIIALIILTVTISNCYSQNKFPELSGQYLGEKPPSKTAKLFLDGAISTEYNAEMCAAFTPDGKEFYFNSDMSGNWKIYCTVLINGKWSKPKPLPFSSDFTDRDFTMSPDGNTIVFGSDRPADGGSEASDRLDIYLTKRTNKNSWSKPIRMDSAINTERGENYPSIAANGNLYFFSNRPDGFGGCDLYMSEFKKGSYQKAVILSDKVNSSRHDWDSFVAPDESYIIFSSLNRDDTVGGQDLYISFRKNGEWTKAVNMGEDVNSTSGEICPSVTPDGKYLFFTSRRRGKADIYWIDAEIIEDLRNSSTD